MADPKEQGAMPWDNLPAYRANFRKRCPLPSPDSVVPELAGRKQWLMWRYERLADDPPERKPRKVPYYAAGKKRLGKQGDDKDRAALVDYATIHAAVLARHHGQVDGWDGVGFAFLPDDGLVGIDLDGMIDPDTEDFTGRCQAIITACETYTELSPSGKGVHIIGFGSLPKSFKSNDVGIEVFCGSQFFTFTGQPWPTLGGKVAAIPEQALARLKKTVDLAKKTRPAETVEPEPARKPPPGSGQRSLAETVALAEEALEHLTADDYHLWIKVGMACRSLGSAGFMVWDAWSATGSKYKAEEMAGRWKSFQSSDLDVGTVFALAKEVGWVAPWDRARSRKRKPPPDSPAESTSPPIKAGAGAGGEGPPPPSVDDPPAPPPDDWQRDLIRKKGETLSCLANAELILAHVPAWHGVIGYDEFAECTSHRTPLPFARSGAAAGPWSDYFDTMTTIWLQRAFRVEFSTGTTGKAIEAVARGNRFHPVREALRSLPKWDGVRRLGSWLKDYLGVVPSVENKGDDAQRAEYDRQVAYIEAVGTYFLRGMIRRVMQPGCKFDYCMVLEGPQGKGKSSVSRILAWHWFADTDLDLSNKDSLLALPGHWVYEVAELGSLMRAEERKQKSFLSRQEDEYRPPYGTRMTKVPRQNVFIGTTNEEEYLKDATGARRFWPVRVGGKVDHDGLLAVRELLYAEALADFEAGERCYPLADEESRLFVPEQAKRGMPEPFEDILEKWVESQTAPFSMATAAMDGLKLTADKLTPAVVTRLGMTLRKLGCGRKENRLAADPGQRRLYVPPALLKADPVGMVSAKEGESADF